MEIATKSQAENGTDNTTVMTPLRVKQSIQANGGGTPLPSNIAYTDQNNHFTQGQMVDGYLTVNGTQWQFGDINVRNGKDIILAPTGPTDTPPTNDAGDIVFNQWRDEGGGAYYEIEKARIWTEDFYGLPVGPNYRAYDAYGNLLYTGRLALENNYSTSETMVGFWVDGKPLYRKVVQITSYPNNAQTYVSTGLSNVNIVNMYGTATNGSTATPINYENTNYGGSFYCYTDGIGSALWYGCNFDGTSYSGYVVLEYTKNS